MRRREFIALLGGAAVLPLLARAQQPERMRRIGVLMNLSADDPEAQTRIAAFMQGLQEAGWVLGTNLRVDFRWGGNANRYRQGAEELAALTPDLILASTDPALVAAQSVARTVPIVFVNVIDPVGMGIVASLSRPGGNTTGFTLFEYGIAGKLLELLKGIAPGIELVGVLRDPTNASAAGQLGAIQAVAPSFGIALTPIDARDGAEVERVVAEFARSPKGGLIVLASGLGAHRDLFIALAARHRLPAIYPFAYYVNAGGLICYGPDSIDQYRRAASYVDRILKGEKPADLPIQAPTKYALTIKLKTAKALGLTVPPTLLARADEVIE
jgi:putative tryptophan/tyrosine transport system substrate-binding protein